MEPATETAAQLQPPPPSQPPPQPPPQSQPLLMSPPTYGYHNTHHTHAPLPVGSPPSYACALDPKLLQRLDERTQHEARFVRSSPLPPAYSCSIEMQGIVGVKQELVSPFHVAGRREWCDVYAVLRGTQLSLHRVKHPSLFSRHAAPTQGKLLRTYSLQHAEAGVASDFKKTAIVPRSPFALMVPVSSRRKLFDAEPHLFEPVREHAIRLRLELEQFLLCPTSEDLMLDWIEALTAAIDISPPLEDRSEPRYRSLPRRNRRQRLLDGSRLSDNMDQLSDLEAGRRLIEQQEQIMRALYPNLAAAPRDQTPTSASPATAEPEGDDFDPEDARFPTTTSARNSFQRSNSSQDEEEQAQDEQCTADDSPSDPKSAPRIPVSRSQNQRYRRRCAPILLASSPRVSDVIFCEGIRARINVRDATLCEYTTQPPRYDAHKFPKHKSKSKRPPPVSTSTTHDVARKVPTPTTTINTTTAAAAAAAAASARPNSPTRGVSNSSISSLSFGEDLAPATSESNADDMEIEIEVEVDNGISRPSSPSGITHVKADAARQLASMGSKRRASEETNTSETTRLRGVGFVL